MESQFNYKEALTNLVLDKEGRCRILLIEGKYYYSYEAEHPVITRKKGHDNL